MGNARREGFLGPRDPPSQGSGPCGQGGGTAAGHGSLGGYCSHVPAPSTVPRASPGCPHHPLALGTGTDRGDPGAPPGEEGTEPGRVFPGRMCPSEGGTSPSPAPRRDATTLPNKAFPLLLAWHISPQHHHGPGQQPGGPQQDQATGRTTCPRHRGGGRSWAPRVPAHTGTRQPAQDVPIGVRRWLWAHTQKIGSWPAGWAAQVLTGGRGSHHGCDGKLGAHGTQLCPQDQAASQDTSTGRCRHQGVSLPQPTGTPRASQAGRMEGAAPALEEADAWHGREGSDQLQFICTAVFSRSTLH